MKRLTNSRLAVCAVVLFVGLAVIPMAFGDEMAATCQNTVTSLHCPGTVKPSSASGLAARQPDPFMATITETGAKPNGKPNQITLPVKVFGGDVQINEPSGVFSDDVRFNDGKQKFGKKVFEYSEVDTPPDPNDLNLPPGFALSANAVGPFTEVGSEGNNGITYTVLNPDGTPNAIYKIVGDTTPTVPEPSTLSLLALFGLGGLAWLRRRGRKV